MNQATFVIFALSVVVIGLTVVALILGILLARSKRPAGSAPAVQARPQAEAPGAGMQAQGVSAEVVAAITAAIAAIWQGESGFVVRHVKRIHNAPAWNRAGRDEQAYSRF